MPRRGPGAWPALGEPACGGRELPCHAPGSGSCGGTDSHRTCAVGAGRRGPHEVETGE
ncbi:hypothetical protein GZL_07261 [Streptomyces sp. 769]|nr:hypothetical protein GZL_07261 [Streptomyces sp. 769]